MQNKNIFQIKRLGAVALVTGLLLCIPLLGMIFSDQVNWNGTDFAVMGILVFVFGFLLDLTFRKSGKYRAATILFLVVLFLYLWAELAVGIFNIPGISGS